MIFREEKYIDTSTQINIFLVLLNLIVVATGVFVAFKAIKHFKLRSLYDQWLIALTDDYHDHKLEVDEFIESEIEDGKMVEQIKNNTSLRRSVNYILDWWGIKAICIKFNIMNRKLAIRLSYHQIIYYFDNLRPWIQYRQKSSHHELIYHDFRWLYLYCKENSKKIEKWGSK